MKYLILPVWIILTCGCQSPRHSEKSSAPEKSRISDAKLSRAFEPLQQAADGGHIGAAVGLVAFGGEIVALRSFGFLGENKAMPVNAICRMASIGKKITAAAVMRLLERNLLDLNDPVADYLPEYNALSVREDPESPALGTAKTPMTIFHLLTHQSGLASEGTEFWQVWEQAKTVREFASMIALLPLEFEPGTAFRYGQMGSSYEVLAAVCEIAANKRFDKIIQDEILDPLEMHDTYFNVNIV